MSVTHFEGLMLYFSLRYRYLEVSMPRQVAIRQ
jgi:hypothetical protein